MKLNKRQTYLFLISAMLLILMGGVWFFIANTDSVEPAVNKPNEEGTISVPKNSGAETAVDSLDDDGDGIGNNREIKLGTDPSAVDTDNDGIWDGEEIDGWKTDPQNPDSDGDGLSDYDEVKVFSTDPRNPDSDGDSYLDGQEVNNNFNPNGSGSL